jgi:hypothetical protein
MMGFPRPEPPAVRRSSTVSALGRFRFKGFADALVSESRLSFSRIRWAAPPRPSALAPTAGRAASLSALGGGQGEFVANELLRGTRRTGDFYDTYADTPEVKVTLERSESGISVTVAWSNPEVPYAAWFVEDGSFLSVGEPHPKPRPVPKCVLFHDSHGTVLLIRCWARGYHANFGGPGSGTLWARAAIMGVREDKEFDRPHGVQPEISGLREWLGITSWEQRFEWSDGTRKVILSSLETSTLRVGQHAGITLDFRSGWGLAPEEGKDRRVLLDLLRCTTRSVEPLDWDAHMQLHRAIRDLLVVSRWRDETCVAVRALREDDPLTTLDGKSHGEQWRDVVVSDDERKSAPKGYHPHLVQYQDLGLEGINRWVALRNEFARALDPIITSVAEALTISSYRARTECSISS